MNTSMPFLAASVRDDDISSVGAHIANPSIVEFKIGNKVTTGVLIPWTPSNEESLKEMLLVLDVPSYFVFEPSRYVSEQSVLGGEMFRSSAKYTTSTEEPSGDYIKANAGFYISID